MTVRVERTVEVSAPPERVWEFIADPAQRANAISVVEEYTVHDDEGRKTTWKLKLPLRVLSGLATVETEDVTRRPPEYVKFVGRSRLMNVTGEHRVEPTDEGARLVNTFVVEGRLPGVERFFKRNLDGEMANLEAALRAELEE